MGRQYRKEAKSAIDRVIIESQHKHGFLPAKEIEQMMRDAYPFGPMDSHACDVYKNEMKRQLKRLRKEGR